MTKQAQAILASLEQLSAADQQAVVAELLRRSAQKGTNALTDEAFVQLAEERFLELDQREAAHEGTRKKRGLAR